jgi:hypothetical protein
MKFMFSTVYRVTQKDFYADLYTSMWAEIWLIWDNVSLKQLSLQHLTCW